MKKEHPRSYKYTEYHLLLTVSVLRAKSAKTSAAQSTLLSLIFLISSILFSLINDNHSIIKSVREKIRLEEKVDLEVFRVSIQLSIHKTEIMVEAWKPYCGNMIDRSEDKGGQKHMTDAVVVLFDSTSEGTYCGSISQSGNITVSHYNYIIIISLIDHSKIIIISYTTSNTLSKWHNLCFVYRLQSLFTKHAMTMRAVNTHKITSLFS